MTHFLALLLAAQGQMPGPSLPSWMAGCWEERKGDRWTEECWTAPRGAIMIGSGRSGKGTRLSSWERMEIVHEETDDPAVPWMTFYGAPGGKNRTAFVWVPDKGPRLTFVNAEHDYPQRIRYWREGKYLIAETALSDGSKAQRWRYSRKR